MKMYLPRLTTAGTSLEFGLIIEEGRLILL